MDANTLNPTQWLNLGLGGAALFILLVSIVMSSNNQNKLASKIDKLADSNVELVKTLSTTLTQWNIEQKGNTSMLAELSRGNSEQNTKLDRIEGKLDTLVNLKCKVQES
jgi:cell shape-determining protein MreC